MKQLLLLPVFLTVMATWAQAQDFPQLAQDQGLHRTLAEAAMEFTTYQPFPALRFGLPTASFDPDLLMTDSTKFYDWNGTDWDLTINATYNNDCAASELIEIIHKRLDPASGQYLNSTREEYTWHSNGLLHTYISNVFDADLNDWRGTFYLGALPSGKQYEGWQKSWDSANNKYTSGSRFLDTYNSDGNIVKSENFELDSPTNTWKVIDRQANTFGTGNLIQQAYREIFDDAAGTLVYDWRSFYTYDASNLPQQILTEDYDLATGTWATDERKLNTYDAQGNLLVVLVQNFESAAWQDRSRVTYTYDASGNRLTDLRESYDAASGQLLPKDRFTHTYNGQDLLVLTVQERYEAGTWKNLIKTEYTYHPNEETERKSQYRWYEAPSLWVEYQRTENDPLGNQLLVISKSGYNESNNTFSSGYKSTYFFDSTSQQGEYTIFDLVPGTLDAWKFSERSVETRENEFQTLEWVHQLWDMGTNNWINDTKKHFFNTGCLFNETQEKASDPPHCAYANPVTAGQNIQCPALANRAGLAIRIHCLTGETAFSGPFADGGEILPPQGLPNGCYVLSLWDGGQLLYRNKIVVVDGCR